MTDRLYLHRIYRTLRLRNDCGNGKTYFYRFSVDSPTNNHFKLFHCGSNVRGCCHADDISYIFKNMFGKVPHKNSMEFRTIQTLVRLNIYLKMSFLTSQSFQNMFTGKCVHSVRNWWESKRSEKCIDSMETGECEWGTIQMFQHCWRRCIVCWFPRKWSYEIMGFIVCDEKYWKLTNQEN